MAGILKKLDRNVIPRWRTFADTVAKRELAFARDQDKQVADFLSEKRQAWDEYRTIWHATDLVGAAIALRRGDEVKDVAAFLLQSPEAPGAALRLARRIVNQRESGPDEGLAVSRDIRLEIRRTKENLHADPRNSIQWIELARDYTIAGLRRQAERAIAAALSLNKENRFILRSAARFYLHNDQPDRAHYILRTAPNSKSDPWIVAAEIAVASASGGASRLVDSGRKLLNVGNHPPFEVTELASALATLELANGKTRSARNLFRQSLEEPTENSLAQAEWAADKVKGLQVAVEDYEISGKYEAAAWDYYNRGDWELALINSRAWLYDQPFSSRPAMLASYLTISIMERVEDGIQILEDSLKASPKNPILLNNLAFGLAITGRAELAAERIRQVDITKLTKGDQAVVTATKGLISYRLGNIDAGRSQYREALRVAKELENPKLYVEGLLYFAQEELRARSAGANEVFAQSVKAAERYEEPVMKRLVELLWKRARDFGALGKPFV